MCDYQDIIKMLRCGGADASLAARQLIHCRIGTVNWLIKTLGASKEDALDAFSEGVFVLLQKARNTEFKFKGKAENYFLSVLKYTAIKALKRKGKYSIPQSEELDNQPEMELNMEEHLINQEKYVEVRATMEKIGKRCKQLLIERIVRKTPYEDIAEFMSFKNKEVARSAKNKCLKKLRELYLNQKTNP